MHVRVLFQCNRQDKKEFAFVRSVDVLHSLDSTEDLLGGICMQWGTDNDADYIDHDLRLKRNEHPVCWYYITEFQSINSVVQIARQNYELVDDVLRSRWATHRFCIETIKKGCRCSRGEQLGKIRRYLTIVLNKLASEKYHLTSVYKLKPWIIVPGRISNYALKTFSADLPIWHWPLSPSLVSWTSLLRPSPKIR